MAKDLIPVQKKELQISDDEIRARIRTARGVHIVLDRDLALLYGVDTGQLNRQVKRNIERFPADFMFQLSKEDVENLKCQFGISSWGGDRRLPFAFTESGVAMLSGILRSKTAIDMNIRIVRAFVAMRKAFASMAPMMTRLEAVERRQITDQSRNEARFDAIFEKMSEGEVPVRQIFYQGQFWDAKSLLIKFIRRAKKDLIVVDAYLGTATLDILAKRTRGVKIEVVTHSNGELAESDLEAFGRQYGKLTKSICGICHDRFIIVDGKEIFAVGASLKDAGRQTFGVVRSGSETIPGLLANLRKATTETRTYG